MKIFLTILTSIFFLTGCLERRIKIQSDPPEAIVLIDGKNIGKTPAEIDFDFYGTREITLIKDNYHIFNYKQKINPSLYSQFPFDFFFEILWPFTIVEEHSFTYTLKPHISLNQNKKSDLFERATKLRTENEK